MGLKLNIEAVMDLKVYLSTSPGTRHQFLGTANVYG
jgi:hypothetical protein